MYAYLTMYFSWTCRLVPAPDPSVYVVHDMVDDSFALVDATTFECRACPGTKTCRHQRFAEDGVANGSSPPWYLYCSSEVHKKFHDRLYT